MRDDAQSGLRVRPAGAAGPGPRRHIVILVHAFPTPSETFVVDHVLGLHRAGWQPTILCGTLDRARLASVAARTGVTVRTELIAPALRSVRALSAAALRALPAALQAPRLGTSRAGVGLIAQAGNLRPALRRLAPAVVHAHFAPAGIAAALALRGSIPLVVDFHGWDFNSFPRQVGWKAMAQALRGCTLVAHSEFAERRVRAGLGAEVVRVPLGVDLDLFRGPERPSAWPRPSRWLVVGRLFGIKGQAIALRTLALARTRDPALDAEITLVGEGPDEVDLRRLAVELRVSERVRFTGALDHGEVAREMTRADLLLVPSVVHPEGAEEAFGRVAIEGLAAGLPVIASAVGGLPEAVGEAGWTVPSADPVALLACIRRVLSERSPAECQRVAVERARRFAIGEMWRGYLNVAEKAAGLS